MKKIIITTLSVALPALAILIFYHPQFSEVKADTVMTPYSESFIINSTTFNIRSDGSAIDYSMQSSIPNIHSAMQLVCLSGADGQTHVIANLSSVGSGTLMMSDIMSDAMNCSPNIQTLAHLTQAFREGHVAIMSGMIVVGTPNPTPSPTSMPSPTPTMTGMPNNPPSGIYYVMVTPDSYYKIQGSSIMFTGNHFYPHEIVTMSGNGNILGTTQVDGNGNFNTGWIAVGNRSGKEIFTFTGSISNIPFSVGITVGGTQPWLNLSTYYAGAGTPLTIVGHGFGSNEPVMVTFDGMNEGISQSDLQGNFSLTMTIPSVGMGTQMVSARGLDTGGQVGATFSQAY